MTVQTKIHDGMLLHLNALTMEVKEILTLIYDTPQIQQVANTYTPQFWGKNPVARLKPKLSMQKFTNTEWYLHRLN